MNQAGHFPLSPAYILHRRDYTETSVIIDCFTETQGRMSLIAHGAKRQKNPWRGILHPFTPLLIHWRGRSQLQTLSHAEAQGSSAQLAGQSLVCGFYLNEVLTRVLPLGEAMPEIFADYQQALAKLPQEECLHPTLRQFEIKLLAHLGYALNFAEDYPRGDPIQPDKRYVYQTECGFVQATPANKQPCVSGINLLQLHAQNFQDKETQQFAKRLTRQLLAPLLGNKPLHSRELLQAFVEP